MSGFYVNEEKVLKLIEEDGLSSLAQNRGAISFPVTDEIASFILSADGHSDVFLRTTFVKMAYLQKYLNENTLPMGSALTIVVPGEATSLLPLFGLFSHEYDVRMSCADFPMPQKDEKPRIFITEMIRGKPVLAMTHTIILMPPRDFAASILYAEGADYAFMVLLHDKLLDQAFFWQRTGGRFAYDAAAEPRFTAYHSN